jgi:hypothetical protein
MRRLIGRAPVSDLFGVKGRRWLAALELPVEERRKRGSDRWMQGLWRRFPWSSSANRPCVRGSGRTLGPL